MCTEYWIDSRAPVPTLPQLKRMSVNLLLALVNRASPEELRELWNIAGIEEPEMVKSCGCRDECDCKCEILDIVFHPREWYFPDEVLDALRSRLPEYADPTVEPSSTLVCDRESRVKIMATRRGEGR